LILLAAIESAEFSRSVKARQVHPMVIDQLREDVRRLARDFVSQPPADVVLRSKKVRDAIFELLKSEQWPQQRREILGLAGQVCGYLAVASSDFYGRYDAASDQCRTAWQCAEMADYGELQSWISSLQSGIAFWNGRWREAAELADRAYVLAETNAAASRGAVLKARALARIGDNAGVQAAVLQSERGDLADLENEQGILQFSEANRLRCVGTAYLWVGDAQSARQHLERALQAYEGDRADDYAAITVARIDLASAHLELGELDGAMEALVPLLDVEPGRRLEGASRRIGDLRRLLNAARYRKSPQALEMSENLADFARETLNVEPTE
jgi:tetratricopeptide (TPR) repeat protein